MLPHFRKPEFERFKTVLVISINKVPTYVEFEILRYFTEN